MPSKGQITLFAILGIVLVLTVLLAIYLSKNSFLPEIRQTDISAEEYYIRTCLISSIYNYTYWTAANGYSNLSSNPIYSPNNMSNLPDLNDIEHTMSAVLSSKYNDCLTTLRQYYPDVVNIHNISRKAIVLLEDKYVLVAFEGGAVIETDDINYTIERELFKSNLPAHAQVVAIHRILENQANETEYFDIGNFVTLAEQQNFSYSIIYKDPDILEINMTSNETEGGRPLTTRFLLRQ